MKDRRAENLQQQQCCPKVATMDTADGVLAELERALHAFMATNADSASVYLRSHPPSEALSEKSSLAKTGDEDFLSLLEQIQWLCGFAASRAFEPVVLSLMAWVGSAERQAPMSIDGPAKQPSSPECMASWLVASAMLTVLDAGLDEPSASERSDRAMTAILDHCLGVFATEHRAQANQMQHESGGFLAFVSAKTSKLSSYSAVITGNSSATAQVRVQDHMIAVWKRVLGRVSRLAFRLTRSKLQQELTKPELVTSKLFLNGKGRWIAGDNGLQHYHHPYLTFLSELRLGLTPKPTKRPRSSVDQPIQVLKDAALLLKVFQPLLQKPFTSRVRRGAAGLLSIILDREVRPMTHNCFKHLYGIVPVSEWNSCISELHAGAMRLTQKRKTLGAGWELRTLALVLSSTDIFARYWKEDVVALLRLQHQHNKDAAASAGADLVGNTVLHCVALSFDNFVLRHILAERRGVPSEPECMEVINTAQAWCFFSSSRQRSFARFQTVVLPVLVDVSVAIAAFNMRYAIQSHLRRLLTEADSVVDEKKLVGIATLLELCRRCMPSKRSRVSDSSTALQLPLDSQMLKAHLHELGEIAGHILIHCNTHLGHELLVGQLPSMAGASFSVPASSADAASLANPTGTPTSRLLRDDNKRALVTELFGTALTSLEFVYNDLELRSDQKIWLLARASVHSSSLIRDHASAALHAVTISSEYVQAGAIIRGVTDYLVQMCSQHAQASDAEAARILITLVSSLLRAGTLEAKNLLDNQNKTCWECAKAVREAFLQVEASAVFLLAHDDASVRVAAVEALESVRNSRSCLESSVLTTELTQPSPLDVIEQMEPLLREKFFSFPPDPDDVAAQTQLCESNAYFKRLAASSTGSRNGFRWSMTLAAVFRRLATELPELMAYFWADVNDKLSKLEPVIATFGELLPSTRPVVSDTTRWRNLAIFATSSACPTLTIATTEQPQIDPDDSTNSIHSAISMPIIATLLKRLTRYLRSTSMEQQKAAIVALSVTHSAAHKHLIDVLVKCEPEAFAMSETAVNSRESGNPSPRHGSFEIISASAMNSARRYSKVMKLKATRTANQFQLQWAMMRCYRMLLEHASIGESCGSTHDNVEELLLSAVSSFLVRVMAALESNQSALAAEASHIYFMIQQDFCATAQLFLRCVGLAPQNHFDDSNAISNNNTLANFVNEAQLVQWVKTLLGWCPSFGTLADQAMSDHLSGPFVAFASPLYSAWTHSCDVFGIRERENGLVLPWLWLDDRSLGLHKNTTNQETHRNRHQQSPGVSSGRVLRYFICHAVFSALTTLVECCRDQFLHPDGATDHSIVCAWLDECFAVDVQRFQHFRSLQRLCHHAARRFLELDATGDFHACCIEKACCTRSCGDKYAIAKQMVVALGTQHERVAHELLCGEAGFLKTVGSCRFVMAMLSHLGASSNDQDASRKIVLDIVKSVLPQNCSLSGTELANKLDSLPTQLPQQPLVLSRDVLERIQGVAASAFASTFPELRFPVCIAVFRFIRDCEVAIQRSMLGAVLPFLLETELSPPYDLTVVSEVEPAIAGSRVVNVASTNTILDLMFELTMLLNSTCGEQLDRMWLTLAYSNSARPDDNLSAIISFLLKKRETSVQLATSKMILWWFARWQDAAFAVISTLVELVGVSRRSQTAVQNNEAEPQLPSSNVNTLDDIATLIILASDTSCHLQQNSSRPCMEVVIQLLHFALMVVWNWVGDSSIQLHPQSIGSEDEPQADQIVLDRDCAALLQTLKPLLSNSAPDSTAAAVNDLEMCLHHPQKVSDTNKSPDPGAGALKFHHRLTMLAKNLSLGDAKIWGELCLKEIVLVLSLANSTDVLSGNSMDRTRPRNATAAVQFSLIVYSVLDLPFNADVFLAVLELLHIALDKHLREPDGFEPLINECLSLLAQMVEQMPPTKLALYPQVFWVCTALLNHFSAIKAQQSTLELLYALLNKPQLTTDEILLDVVACKRPTQWSTAQSSLLRALVVNLHTGTLKSRRMATELTTRSILLLPPSLLMVSETERVVTCTVGLIPILAARALPKFPPLLPDVSSCTVSRDLASQWDKLASEGSGDAQNALFRVAAFLRSNGDEGHDNRQANGSTADEYTADLNLLSGDEPGSLCRPFLAAFARCFVPAIVDLQQRQLPIDCLAVVFDTITRTLSSIENRQSSNQLVDSDPISKPSSPTYASTIVTTVSCVLTMTEELIQEIFRLEIAWSPQAPFIAILARMLRRPERKLEWQSAARMLTYLSVGHSPAVEQNSSVAALKTATPPLKGDGSKTLPKASSANQSLSTAS